MSLTREEIFEHILKIEITIDKTTDPTIIAELNRQIRVYEVMDAIIINNSADSRIALLKPMIARLEEINLELDDQVTLLNTKKIQETASVANPIVDIDSDTSATHASSDDIALNNRTTSPINHSTATSFKQIDVDGHDQDLNKLHPVVREKVIAIQKQLAAENIPLRLFEAFRSPERQAHLFAKNNGVTGARAWRSYHQYGMAADFVLHINGNWSWDVKKLVNRRHWERYHEIARENGLHPLNFEKPHVQLIGTSSTRLRHGDYPEGGDASWAKALTDAIRRWPGDNKPPLPMQVDRPPNPMANVISANIKPQTTIGWHNKFDGDAWYYDRKGVHSGKSAGADKIWRTPGPPTTVNEVLAYYQAEIFAASKKFNVPPELIIMTIATETAAQKINGFTGSSTFRWEKKQTLKLTGDPRLDGKEKGDYSAGPMQVLSTTARWVNEERNLGYDNAQFFEWFIDEPTPKPTDLGLYSGEVCIDVGTAYIALNMTKTGDDPILVAAAYNSGGIKPSSGNHWRLRSHGNHLDRAAEWYGDACAVLYGQN